MAVDVIAAIDVERKAETVAAYAFEPTNDPTWIGGISQADLLTGRPIGTGTRVRRLAKFLGRSIDYVLEVRAFETDRLMVMESVKGPFPMKVTYQLESRGPDLTGISVRVQGSAKSFYGLADILMAPMVRMNVRRDLRRLKEQLEKR
jgi:hypothetical protein